MNNYYDIWLSRVNISNENKMKLFKIYKSSENIWKLSKEELLSTNLRLSTVEKVLDSKIRKTMDKYIEYIKHYNIKIIRFNEKEYPTQLNIIDDKPVIINVRGRLENLYHDCVAIVGSRKASEYGKFTARKIAKELADRNINIISGLAIGIDKFAHLGALDSNIGKTIAVLGTGLLDSEVYPYENKNVFKRILENDGTIISEYPLGTKPNRYNFPLRNRIISGLASKIIVVEAKQNSGSFITVNYALEQGKDIYAVPGNIDSENSKGTNLLISEGAYIFRKIEDIF